MMLPRPFLTLLLLTAAPALAEPTPPVAQRVDRLEKEMKAVQRKAFPGGAPAFVDPEISAPPATMSAGTPASQPINDLTSRVDGLEKELARLTAQVEEAQHRLGILSEQSARDRGEFDTRLKTLESATARTAQPAPALPAEDAPKATLRPAKGKPAKPGPTVDPAPTSLADAAKPAPAGADPAEDAYMAGYKLWTDKKFPDAEAQLAKVVKQYPKHRRASYARNLLGRAQLDEGKPATAAQTFIDNYKADPHGERAPDSLFYLGQALTQLKKADNACRAYDELQDVYATTMSDAIKAKLPAARKAAACK